jgi:transposase InsO family protein
MNYSLNLLYEVVGVSKQSVQQARRRQQFFDKELTELVVLADQLKEEHPGCGVEKMFYTLRPKLMGRDKFCEVFMELGYGVKRIRNYHRTTYSGTYVYPNLIEGMAIRRPFQVVQSDITYFHLNGNFYYLVFIIDVYTRMIVGYSVNDNLRTKGNLAAMKMALKTMIYRPWGLIHHSDRGSQYSSKEYTELLEDYSINISMGSVAWENPHAERINGIIKNEYLKRWMIKDLKALKKKVAQAVKHYNTKRLHRAFKMKFTPKEFYEKQLNLSAQERPTVIVYTEGRKNFKGASSPFEVCPREEPLAHDCPMELYNDC